MTGAPLQPLRTLARRAGVRRPRPRRTAAAARMRLERVALAVRSDRGTPRSRILCYHGVGTPEWGLNDVTVGRFRRQLETALDLGYRFVTAAELSMRLMSPTPGAGDSGVPLAAVTFDDGLRSVATAAAPILKELEIPATVFIVSDWADGNHTMQSSPFLTWPEVLGLAEAGFAIGSHSRNHPDFSRLGPAAMTEQLRSSKEVIAARTGITCSDFAIPFGQSGNWPAGAGQLAAAEGYRRVYAQSENRRPAGTVPRTFVSRFDGEHQMVALLCGAYDNWEEWV